MFQVASHPAAFHLREHSSSTRRPSYDSHSRSQQPQNPALQLPRTLTRPPFTDISRDALAAAAPDLCAASVPIEFIRHGLRAKAPSMQAGIASLAPSHLPQNMSIPRDRLPSALTVPLCAPPHGVLPSYPTHALAISPASSKSSSGKASIFAVHSVVLAAHCAKLPPLPPARAPSASGAVTLPVLPFALPSPPAFTILHAYMYTHRVDAVLAALLPLPSSFLAPLSASSGSGAASTIAAALASPPHLHTLAAHLASHSSSNISTLLEHAAHVKELWQDMVALGMYDPPLWSALDLAWEVVLGAMNVVAQ
ncbi:hypothetical protein K438DRAFT_1839403 [Mycena galopus ATCC 62051]|nr:hypothetical protein K438DRAFT_1839403 [Mycena galopus ATCC 62051]